MDALTLLQQMTASRDHFRTECMKADDRAQAADAEIARLRAENDTLKAAVCRADIACDRFADEAEKLGLALGLRPKLR